MSGGLFGAFRCQPSALKSSLFSNYCRSVATHVFDRVSTVAVTVVEKSSVSHDCVHSVCKNVVKRALTLFDFIRTSLGMLEIIMLSANRLAPCLIVCCHV